MDGKIVFTNSPKLYLSVSVAHHTPPCSPGVAPSTGNTCGAGTVLETLAVIVISIISR